MWRDERWSESGGVWRSILIVRLKAVVAMMGEKFAGQSSKAGETMAGLESQFNESLNQGLAQSTRVVSSNSNWATKRPPMALALMRRKSLPPRSTPS